MLRRTGGYTLVEMLGAMTIIAIAMASLHQVRQGWAEDAIVRRTVEGFTLVDEAVYAYRIDNPGTWPGTMALLAPYLGASGGASNGVGMPYTLTPAGSRLTIGTTMLDATQAREVAAAFPLTATHDPTTFEVEFDIPIPGHESAHNNLLHLDGSRAMHGNFDVGGFDIVNAGDVTASGTVAANQVAATAGVTAATVQATGTVEGSTAVLTGTVTDGGGCTSGGVGLDSGGRLLTCQGGTWTEIPGCGLSRASSSRQGTDHVVTIEDDCGNAVAVRLVGSNA